MSLQPLPVLDTVPLLAPLHAELVALLRRLGPDDWTRPTAAGAWQVRDVAAHLLDVSMRKLSAYRDAHIPAPDRPVEGYDDVLALVQRLNAGGVAFGRRLSPRLLTELLEFVGRAVIDFTATLDPEAPAVFAVAWAGEAESTNRFDTAREYTEWWHHQMQIRDALGDGGSTGTLLEWTYLEPLLETSVRALPHAYRTVAAADGTTVVLRVAATGAPADAAWTLRRDPGRWTLHRGSAPESTAIVTAPPDLVWRLFYNALPEDRARSMLTMRGPDRLIAPLLRTRSVMV